MRVRRRNALVAMVAVVLGMVLGVVLSATTESTADALCPSGQVINLSWGYERSLGAHCTTSPDGFYVGEISDLVTDGSCVWVEYWEGGATTWIQQWECTTGRWSSYGWFDQNGDVTSLARLCRNQGCSLYHWNDQY